MPADAGNWCLIESDPGVFTELVRNFGVSGVQIEEIWSLDDESFAELKPVLGIIFLFKWQPDGEVAADVVRDDRLREIFFAKQVIQNACATQALLSILLNCADPDVQLGPTLANFKAFTADFDPQTRGLSISNSDEIRNVHNSFSRQSMFEFDEKLAGKDDDVFHFVAYVPIRGRLYELDGLKEGPVDLGAVRSDWLHAVRPVIAERMRRYESGEIKFNLMAVVTDRLIVYQKRLEAATDEAEREQLAALMAQEASKRQRQAVENVRRKHNYLPFIVETLRLLARDGRLTELVAKAKEKSKERLRQEEERKQKRQKLDGEQR